MGYASQCKLFKIAGHSPAYFQNKRAAKKMRDKLSATLASSTPRFVVMRGSEHWRGESFNTVKRTRGARSTW